MMIKEHLRSFLATVFTGFYLFVALFSQNFHNHGSGEVFKDYHLKKSEKTFSKSSFSTDFIDCLSCHLLHDGHSLLPEDFQLAYIQTDDFQKEIFAYAQRFSKLEIRYFELRGPPSNFI